MTVRNSLILLIALSALGNQPCTAQSVDQQTKTDLSNKGTLPMSEAELKKRGQELRAEIEGTYNLLAKRHLLLAQNDIHEETAAHIPLGMSLKHAETILRYAGMTVVTPGLDLPGNGIRATANLTSSSFTKVEVLIELSSDLPHEADGNVSDITALIIYTSL